MNMTQCQQDQAVGLVAGVLIITTLATVAVLVAYMIDFTKDLHKEITHAMQGM